MFNSNEYKNSFADYTNKILELDKEFHFINQTKKENGVKFNLTDNQKEIIINLLKKKTDIGDVTGGDFENVIDVYFPSKVNLLTILQNILVTTTDKEEKEAIKAIIETVFEIAEKEAHNGMYDITPSARNSSISLPTRHVILPPVIDAIIERQYETRAFLYNRSLNKDYLPTVDPTPVDTSAFAHMSLNELQAMFLPSNFYKLNGQQVCQLSQAYVNAYCASLGVPSCRVNFNQLKSDDSAICFGMYYPNKGMIDINKKFILNLNFAKETGNPNFSLRLLSTLTHEAHHRYQFASLDNENKNARDKFVSYAIVNNKDKVWLANDSKVSTMAEYLSEPDEIDARDAALAAIYNLATIENDNITKTDRDTAKLFFNNGLKKEQQNVKQELKPEYKKLFNFVYSNESFDVSGISKGVKQEFKNSIVLTGDIIRNKTQNNQMLKY